MTSKFKRIRSLVVVAGFALLFLLPAIQRLSQVLPDPPLDEKRLLQPAPAWTASLRGLNTYLMGWQSWFNDRYPGRNLLIRLKTQLDYSLFSYSDRIYIGSDGWLFYRSVLDGQIRGEAAVNQAEIDSYVAQFRGLRMWLAARGVTLVIVDNQMKYIFYPERLPKSAPHLPDFSRYQELRRRLRDETGAVWIDSTAILEALKPQRPVFHRTDFHWNDPAAFAVAEQVVDRLAGLLGQPRLAWRLKLEIEKKPNSGGEASFMPLLRPVTEEALFVRPTWTDAPADLRMNELPFEFVHRLKDPAAAVLPPIVVFGDSFFDGMLRSGFWEHFSAVYRTRLYQAPLEEVLRHFPADARFMLVEFIEPSGKLFPGAVGFPALPPQSGKAPMAPAER